MTLAVAVAAVPLAIWIYLLLARGRFWWPPRELPPSSGGPLRTVVAIVPARNEAAGIATAARSLLTQRFTGTLHVVVVDDGSVDGTAEVARGAAAAAGALERLTVIRGAPLAEGWTGKLWAMSQGVEAAAGRSPDFLLFTDADIEHDPDNVAALVAAADSQRLDLVSLMVRLSTASFAERCLIPAFVFFFLKLYPPAWIAAPRARTAGAAGGCMLVRPDALARAGGLAAIRGRIIDDCALAAAVKGAGGALSLGLTRRTRSLRVYGTFGEIGAMISRTAFNQLRHSYLLLGGTLLGLAVTYLAPPLLVLAPDRAIAALGAAAWLLMTLCYLPLVRYYRLSGGYALLLPAVAAFYAAATVHSAIRYATGRGGHWKGRVQNSRSA